MFWSEQYEKPEESIWEELKRMMLNPPSETDKKNKKLQEQAWIDTVLDKAFPQENKTPLLKSGVSYEKSLDPYAEIDSKKDWSEEKKSQKKAEVARIREAAASREKEINREHLLNQAKNYGGAALEIGSAFVPAYGGPKLVGAVANKLAPKVGRKIAQELASGVLKGASSGTVEGFGRGLIEDENPFKTAVQDTVTGTLGGLGLGAGGAKVEKGIRGNNLRKYGDIDLLNYELRKKYNTDARRYYKDYIQTTDLLLNGNKVDLSGRGIQEQLRWNPKFAQSLSEFKNDIKNAKLINYESNKDLDKQFTKNFEVYRGKIGDHLIEVNNDNFRRYYITRSIPDGTSRTTSADSIKDTINIIPSSAQNLNPSQSAKVYETSTHQTPKSDDEWLKWLKRKRKGLL